MHSEDRDCPISTNIFLRKQSERRGVSLTQCIREYSEETGAPIKTVEKWVWSSSPKNGGAHGNTPDSQGSTENEVENEYHHG